jgi:hypothetical protein
MGHGQDLQDYAGLQRKELLRFFSLEIVFILLILSNQ